MLRVLKLLKNARGEIRLTIQSLRAEIDSYQADIARIRTRIDTLQAEMDEINSSIVALGFDPNGE